MKRHDEYHMRLNARAQQLVANDAKLIAELSSIREIKGIPDVTRCTSNGHLG